MGWDIYGQPLRPGHCEVHPNVHEEYPCSLCYEESNRQRQRKYEENLNHHQAMMIMEFEAMIIARMLEEGPGLPHTGLYFFPKQADFIFQDRIVPPEVAMSMIRSGTLTYVGIRTSQGEQVPEYCLTYKETDV